MNTTACKRLFSLGCVPHTDGAVFQGGAERAVTVANLGEYLSLLAERWFGAGIALQRRAFQDGLRDVLELDALLAFTGPEVVAMICGEQAAWDAAELRAMIRPGYGYTQESAPIAWLREFLCGARPSSEKIRPAQPF